MCEGLRENYREGCRLNKRRAGVEKIAVGGAAMGESMRTNRDYDTEDVD